MPVRQREPSHEKSGTPCCPDLAPAPVCDSLDFSYRFPIRVSPTVERRQTAVLVEVELRFRLTRCSGKLAQGDLAYSTTILPGETVRLFTSDRHSRFTFDSESRLAYRNETSSEESYFAAGMAEALSNVSTVDSGRSSSNFHEGSVSGGGKVGIDLGIFELGGDVRGSSHDASTVADFTRAISTHAESSSRHAEVATRAMSSVSIGEVQSRTHTQGESEDHFESASRMFENRNACHAVTYFFYRINKIQELSWDLVAIERRVADPSAPSGATLRRAEVAPKLTVLPAAILATAKARPEAERADRASIADRGALGKVATLELLNTGATASPAIDPRLRAAALATVDRELQAQGLLDRAGAPAAATVKRLHWERTISIPTPGIQVKGCLDECNTCEPAQRRRIELELEEQSLKNELLKKQIALLEKSQEYRCCPGEDGQAGADHGSGDDPSE